MKKQDKRKAPAEAPSKGMSIDAILEWLSDLKDVAIFLKTPRDDPDVMESRIAACESATDILTALQDEGIKDPEQVRDLIHDYNALAEQYQKMHQRYEVAAAPVRFTNGLRTLAHLCPDCRSQSRPGNAYCWNCGKRLDWRR